MCTAGSAGRAEAASAAYTLIVVLHIHRAARADALADALAGMLATPPADAFAPEVVAVPTRGMERWLTQRMSTTLGARAGHADGVCANVVFPSPHRLISDAVATASGIEPADDSDRVSGSSGPWCVEPTTRTRPRVGTDGGLLGRRDGSRRRRFVAIGRQIATRSTRDGGDRKGRSADDSNEPDGHH